MSQHDFNIANQGFPAFRADLNSGLEALATNSSGSTQPSTTFAYQFWYDEANDLLKMRNSDNDAWITLASFDQATDEWEVRSAVVQAVDSAGVEIKTDDGTTRLDIADDGTVTIAGDLTVSGTLTANLDSNIIEQGNSSVEVVDAGTGSIQFTTDGTEAARFDANGNLGIGTNNPSRQLEVFDDGTNGQAVLALTAQNTDPSVIFFADTDDTNVGGFQYLHSTDTLNIRVNDDTRAAITSTGDFQFDSGYGSAATAYGCRAWVNFDGTGTVSIRESGNVSSITDNGGLGQYSVNFVTAMPDTNYAINASAFNYNVSSGLPRFVSFSSQTASIYNDSISTSFFRISVHQTPDVSNDSTTVCCSVFR